MIAIGLVNTILNRLSYSTEAYFVYDEVVKWPESIFNLLLDAKLLQPAEAETNIICDGCEENCLMPVTVIPAQSNKPGRPFVYCDKDSNMGRIPVEQQRLQRWYISPKTLAECIGRLLRLPVEAICQRSQQQWHLGIYQGTANRRPLILDFSEGVALLLAGQHVPLIDCIEIVEGQFSVNKHKLNKMVANPQGTDETATERRERLEARKQQLKTKGISNFNEVLAKEEGISVSAIKQIFSPKASITKKITQ